MADDLHPSNTSPIDASGSLVDLSARKLLLEIEKLEADTSKAREDASKTRLEIRRLSSPWYQRPEILQPLATISIAAIAATVGYSNGWFQTKLESLRNAQDRATLELRELNDRRSELHGEIARLQTEREDLSQRLTATIAKAESLQAAYAKAAAGAAETERYRAEVAEIQKQLETTISEATAAKAAVDATKWHTGDPIAITVLDARSRKPLSKGLIRRIAGNTATLPRGSTISETSSFVREFWRRLADQVTSNMVPLETDQNGRATVLLTSLDVAQPGIQFVISRIGYEETFVSVPWGQKTLTVYIKATVPNQPADIGTKDSLVPSQ